MRCTNPNGRYVDWQWSPFWRVDLWGYIRTDLRFAQVPLCLYRASGSDPSCSRGESFRPGNPRGITDYAHTPIHCLLAPGLCLLAPILLLLVPLDILQLLHFLPFP